MKNQLIKLYLEQVSRFSILSALSISHESLWNDLRHCHYSKLVALSSNTWAKTSSRKHQSKKSYSSWQKVFKWKTEKKPSLTIFLRVIHTPKIVDVISIGCKAIIYSITDNILYRKTFMGPMARCVRPTEARTIMHDIHSEMCAMDSGSRAVAAKALLIGYYFPIVSQDTEAELKTCPKCCAYAIILRAPKHDLIPIITPWPFHRWGINILGSFPAPPGKLVFHASHEPKTYLSTIKNMKENWTEETRKEEADDVGIPHPDQESPKKGIVSYKQVKTHPRY
ncbi:hypothetical protein Tco_0599236 [Tanacetum coccineum]